MTDYTNLRLRLEDREVIFLDRAIGTQHTSGLIISPRLFAGGGSLLTRRDCQKV
jgi:hypothetical protein